MAIKKVHPLSIEAFRKMPQDDGVKYELIDGQVYMQARPHSRHNKAQSYISGELHSFLKGKECNQIFEQEVRLGDSIVIPDIFVYCDKLSGQTYEGTLLLVVEVLSPSTQVRDYNTKMALYQAHGVVEYWIVNPTQQYITVFNLVTEEAIEYSIGDKLKSIQLDGFEIDIRDIFQ